ncbi:MAG TPA: hypothetical protein VE643_06295, partial [Nitrososphaeraceae archaeon]|nr:hypothetical protein [Nitrososphaeraceae archaeon]
MAWPSYRVKSWLSSRMQELKRSRNFTNPVLNYGYYPLWHSEPSVSTACKAYFGALFIHMPISNSTTHLNDSISEHSI